MLSIHVLTLFPEHMRDYFLKGIMGTAHQKGFFSINFIDIRSFAIGSYRSVDDYPFGGKLGMLLIADVVSKAIESISNYQNAQLIFPSPKGLNFDAQHAKKLAFLNQDLIFLCGYYEGVDDRLFDRFSFSFFSVGDLVLSSGELASLLMIDGICRYCEGVLGNSESSKEESFESGLLEHPQYTKPLEFQKKQVPEVLLSGHHQKIKDWKISQSIGYTLFLRPDLIAKKQLSPFEKQTIDQLIFKGGVL